MLAVASVLPTSSPLATQDLLPVPAVPSNEQTLVILDRLQLPDMQALFDSRGLVGAGVPRLRIIWCDFADELAAVAARRPDAAVVVVCRGDAAASALLGVARGLTSGPLIALTPPVMSEAIVGMLAAGADLHLELSRGDDVIRAFVRAALRRLTIVRELPPASTATRVAHLRAPSRDDDMLPPVLPRSGMLEHFGPLAIDRVSRRVLRDGVEVRLTRTEFALLDALSRKPDVTQTHRELYAAVWGTRAGDTVHYVRIYVRELREKLEAVPSLPTQIITVPRLGYRFLREPQAAWVMPTDAATTVNSPTGALDACR